MIDPQLWMGTSMPRPLDLTLNRLQLVIFDVDSLRDPTKWAHDLALSLLNRLLEHSAAGALAESRTLVVALLPYPCDRTAAAHRAAAIASMRAIIAAVVSEFRSTIQPLNALAIDHDDPTVALEFIRFLDSEDGGYSTGTTVDLTTKEPEPV